MSDKRKYQDIRAALNEILKQPIDGVLYDLDLLPEQCKTIEDDFRRLIVEDYWTLLQAEPRADEGKEGRA